MNFYDYSKTIIASEEALRVDIATKLITKGKKQ